MLTRLPGVQWVGKIPGQLREEAAAAGKDGDTEMKDADAGGAEKGGPPSSEAADGRVKPKQRYHVGVNALGFRRDDMEVVPALKDGLYEDWEVVESLWDTAFE